MDPIESRQRDVRQREAARKAAAQAEARTFRTVAAACIAAEAPGWKNQRTAALWKSSLEQHAFPVLGDIPIAEIDRAKVREAIDAVWVSAPSIGRKVLRRILPRSAPYANPPTPNCLQAAAGCMCGSMWTRHFVRW
ncbi:hypothetical protein JYK14_19725 [Siccirubricoccus sp. KC 17139]|uniref:Phage integrase central domain-containing protein n=1 Tax=Siccirubricoccus soli TaxID=2899147 RepID=A0ABT1D8W4_9PROT|nr:hypothetical protein [Siccirubricoccus soli]MCO6418377.1 hypothetical protein [Siccirubricoccus soli]MCP2684512.1 hypothetical protein [Siccirubricoccus soli]